MSILASAFPPSPSLSEIGRASTTQRKQWPGRSQVRQEAPHDPGGTGERAFQGGCRTAPEIASCTGLPLKHACAIARLLESRGAVERRGYGISFNGGRRPVFYEPKPS